MRNNPSSDIPKARALLVQGLNSKDWKYVQAALPLMVRAKAIRRAKRKQGKITAKQILAAKAIIAREPNTHFHEIANRTGLRNGGRVSEIANDKRKSGKRKKGRKK